MKNRIAIGRSCFSVAMVDQANTRLPLLANTTAGFTLVELVVVIVIVGVLASFAVPRFISNETFAERGYFEELVAALRFAQKTAVATGCPVRATVFSSGYSFRQQQQQSGRCDRLDTTWPTLVQLTDGTTLDSTAPTGVTSAPDTTFVFDALGTTSLGADQTFNVGAHSLVVRAGSGYVDVP